MKFAIVTFIYPKAIPYFYKLLENINKQDDLNFQLIIFNDGVENPHKYLESLSVSYKLFELSSNSIIGLRFEGIELLKALNFDYYIFQDCDDELSENRIATIKQYSNDYEIIVNDLDIIDENSKLVDRQIWAKRLDNREFSFDSIKNYNFVGLGNTSISKSMLKYSPELPIENIIAVDWYLFYKILLNSGEKGFFTSECVTKYRQHTENSIGIANSRKIDSIIDTKNTFHRLISNEIEISVKSTNSYKIPKKTKHNYPFWWELKIK